VTGGPASFVVDASVAIAALFDDDTGGRARRLLESVGRSVEVPWQVPGVFDLACASGILSLVRRGALPRAQGLRGVAELCSLPAERVPSRVLLDRAVAISLSRPVTVCDGCSVALAERNGIPLVTLDAKLVRALHGSAQRVLLLAEIEPVE
jgi:predicted nucleic acid-binding protein